MFVWNDTPSPSARQREGSRLAMYRRELEDRAALLYRLGYSAARCKQRLQANVAWDFELNGKPKHGQEINRIVDAVYRRGGPGPGTPTV